MRVYAFKRNEKKTELASIVIRLNKREFEDLKHKYESCWFINNINIIKTGLDPRKVTSIDKFYSTLCSSLLNNEKVVEHLNKASGQVSFAIKSFPYSEVKKKAKSDEFIEIFKLFNNNITVKDIVYNDNMCYADI